ncbi:MAG: DNA-3-methyladenine glycosylase 2 family protein [Deltaproteobacteria bacterium]|nr:DNA-3-methyladenine glycosylase 2 family protein [Deltaproteobacteria bacterium]
MNSENQHQDSTFLAARQPFDFTRSLAFLGAFAPMAGEQRLGAGSLTKALREAGVGATVGFTVRAAPGGVTCRLHTAPGTTLTPAQRTRVLDRVRFFLSLDDDLGPLYARAAGDAAFAPVLRALHGFHQVKLTTPFENACWAVLGQRCPIPVARRLKDRLTAAHGGALLVEGQTRRAFPCPADLAEVDVATLTGLLGHHLKAQRIAAVTRAFAAVDEAFLRHGAFEEVRRWLLDIDGIGPWSAAFVMLRGLGRMEHIASAEAQLLPHLEARYGALTRPALRALEQRYGDQRGYWVLYVRAAEALVGASPGAAVASMAEA